MFSKLRSMLTAAICIAASTVASAQQGSLVVHGLTVTPHVVAESMRYIPPAEPAPGARVEMFLLNTSNAPLTMDGQTPLHFGGRTPAELLEANDWAWHSTPAAAPNETVSLAPGALTVWSFNSRAPSFGPGAKVSAAVGPEDGPWLSQDLHLDAPQQWISAITFLAPDGSIQPDRMIVHLANASDRAVQVRSCRLWLPADPRSPRVLLPRDPAANLAPFNGHGVLPANDRGGFVLETGPLPLTYAAVEVRVAPAGAEEQSLWAHLRIKPERFDISGGWVGGGPDPLTSEVFLKTLKRLYVNTAHIGITPGYSDTELYDRYPIKYFGHLDPAVFDTDAMLPRVHGVEILGEPQYGGGRPVPPQECWEKLYPYATTRLATTVTHSEERIWRDYAGISDYPHYDAYRVSAPSADTWQKYDRWDGQRVWWGAPLETIGDMSRTLRELNRPMPCAIWSQGPHEGWDVYGRRKRTTPTPDEIRLQAYHALSTRITSLYWFNLSLKTIVKWRDTLDELERIGREMRMIDEFLLEGDAYGFERLRNPDGTLDWDIASVTGPQAALLFALDLDYKADPEERVFKFGPPREASWKFTLPAYLGGIADVFRLDSEGAHEVDWSAADGGVAVHDSASRVALYIATPDKSLRDRIEEERQALIAAEQAIGFDPAHNDEDFAALKALLD